MSGWRRGLLGVAAFAACGAGLGETPLWPWRPGVEPLDLGSDRPDAATCGACHTEQLAGWEASRHRSSWTNDLFQAGYLAEPLEFCVLCHAPSPEALAEVRANRSFYASFGPSSRVPPGSVRRQPEPHAAAGIDCATCHWRDGAVLSPAPASDAPHPVRATSRLRDGEFCVTCHDFGFAHTVNGRTTVDEAVRMQATGQEWRAWRAAGGQASCQDCHMPGGDHRVRGASDRDFLRASVQIEAEPAPGGLRFTLRSVGVGHHLPTGDLFRHLTLEIARGEAWEVVDWIGRRFAFDAEGRARLASDTALRPDQPREVRVEARGRVRWRLRWHDGAAHDEARGLVPLGSIVETLAEGELRAGR